MCIVRYVRILMSINDKPLYENRPRGCGIKISTTPKSVMRSRAVPALAEPVRETVCFRAAERILFRFDAQEDINKTVCKSGHNAGTRTYHKDNSRPPGGKCVSAHTRVVATHLCKFAMLFVSFVRDRNRFRLRSSVYSVVQCSTRLTLFYRTHVRSGSRQRRRCAPRIIPMWRTA